jgi:hypothetical protein
MLVETLGAKDYRERAVAAGWAHRRQVIVSEFLQTENRLLRDRLRGKRIRFTHAELALSRGKPRQSAARPCSNWTRSFLPILCGVGTGG